MKYFETPVIVKDVLFNSYEQPTKREPFGVLNMAFRLPHMDKDWYVMEIKKDALHYLYSALIYHQPDETKEDLLPVFTITEDDHFNMLKAILNESVTQQALETYEFKPMIDVYVKQEPFEVVVCDYEGDVTDETPAPPMHVTSYGFCYDSRMDAFAFYQDVVADYVDMYEQVSHPYFGMWTFQEIEEEITYVLLLFEGNLIRTKQTFDALGLFDEDD